MLVVGGIEEGVKLAAVMGLVVRRGPRPAGVLLAAMAGLGFASVENLLLGRMLYGSELWGGSPPRP
jgi:RsiW-degrading membrane proteinase PrsW (M82 family)